MLLSIESLPAAEGDCLVLHWGSVAKPKLGVVDGGPGKIYENHLRPRLDEIRDSRGLDILELELVMVSHLDSDHIVGVKKLFRQLRKGIDDPRQGVSIKVKRLWHNIFNDVVGDRTDALYRSLSAQLTASVEGTASEELTRKLRAAIGSRYPGTTDDRQAEEAMWLAAILAGHGEGRQLRDDFEFLHQAGRIASLNTPFEDSSGRPTLIQTGGTTDSRTIAGLRVKVIGPRTTEIDELQREFDIWLQKNGKAEASLLAAYADKSAKNLSSIVCLVEQGGKRILLTGDARGDNILAASEDAGLLENGVLHVDVLKVPHHGSDNNVEDDFFTKIIADHYIFSGDGKHGNPERATLEMLTQARGRDAQYGIHLTYPVSKVDILRKRDTEAKGGTWTAKSDSLKSFFARCEKDGHAFTVNDRERVLIELGDESIEW